MIIDHSIAIKNIRDILDDSEDLYTLLSHYIGCEEPSTKDILDNLSADNTLYEIADQNDLSESDMTEWIKSHLDNSVECKIFHESGPHEGLPVVEVICLDMIFYLDWANC